MACKSDCFDPWLFNNLQIFINQYSSAELQTPGISVYSFARDYLCLQFWSFCFLPHPSQGEIVEILKSCFRVKIPIWALPILVHELKVERDLSGIIPSTVSRQECSDGGCFWSETDISEKLVLLLFIRRVTWDWRLILQVTVTQSRGENFCSESHWRTNCKILITYKQAQWLKITYMHYSWAKQEPQQLWVLVLELVSPAPVSPHKKQNKLFTGGQAARPI